MRIFELGPGRKFRASMGPSGFLRLELRTPSDWTEITAPDVLSQATNALALFAAGEPVEGFRFTNDDRYCGPADMRGVNPFEYRAQFRR